MARARCMYQQLTVPAAHNCNSLTGLWPQLMLVDEDPSGAAADLPRVHAATHKGHQQHPPAVVKGVWPHLMHVLQALLPAIVRVQQVALLPSAGSRDISQQAANLNAHHHERGAVWVVRVLCKVKAHDMGLSGDCWVAPAGR